MLCNNSEVFYHTGRQLKSLFINYALVELIHYNIISFQETDFHF